MCVWFESDPHILKRRSRWHCSEPIAVAETSCSLRSYRITSGTIRYFIRINNFRVAPNVIRGCRETTGGVRVGCVWFESDPQFLKCRSRRDCSAPIAALVPDYIRYHPLFYANQQFPGGPGCNPGLSSDNRRWQCWVGWFESDPQFLKFRSRRDCSAPIAATATSCSLRSYRITSGTTRYFMRINNFRVAPDVIRGCRETTGGDRVGCVWFESDPHILKRRSR
ncbi:hypothetical protein GmarT_13250 [Gimesia maris]|uniref:Uncharacterized protein n=1 Tax=Gimesia maris TaxID=122 RepID=A0ABX5YIH0_9PLAN|nr:hypothetical protein GmarT_13250 [Gimesia maris]